MLVVLIVLVILWVVFTDPGKRPRRKNASPSKLPK